MEPFVSGGGVGGPADYAFMIAFGMSVMLLLGWLLELPLLGYSLVFMIIYVWSRKFADRPVSLFGAHARHAAPPCSGLTPCSPQACA